MKSNKKVVRLTESKLKEMIAESVKKCLIYEHYKNGKFYGAMFPNQPFNSEESIMPLRKNTSSLMAIE